MKKYNQFLNELKKSTWEKVAKISSEREYGDLSQKFKSHSDNLGEIDETDETDVINSNEKIKKVNIDDLIYVSGIGLVLGREEVKFTNKKDAIKFIKIKELKNLNPKDIIYGYKPIEWPQISW